jgi:hypothetical protein
MTASNRLLPVVTVCDFCSFATCYASPTGEIGQEQTFDLTRCRHTVRLT